MMHASNECNAGRVSTIWRNRPRRRRGLQKLLFLKIIELLHIFSSCAFWSLHCRRTRNRDIASSSKLVYRRKNGRSNVWIFWQTLSHQRAKPFLSGILATWSLELGEAVVLIVSYLVYATPTVEMGAVDVVARPVRMA